MRRSYTDITILGYRIVGSGIKGTIDHAITRSTEQLHVFYILIRKGKAKTLPYMCDDIQTILWDTSADAIVETIGGLEPAHTYILQASESDRHVVTVNKMVIAAYSKEFTDVAREYNVHIYYEANTGDGIPWIEGLAKTMRIDKIDRIHGIFNGIGNYILGYMQRCHTSFEDTLREAQELGYAEVDPSADIGGYDICNKLRTSANLVYDYHVLDTSPVLGIRSITKQDASYLLSLGYAVRLIAETRRNANHYGYVAEPVLFETGPLESNTQDNYNLTALHRKTIGDLKFFGQDAGKSPATNATVQDLTDLKEGICHMDPSFTNTMSYNKTLCLCDYILRADEAAHDELQDFSYEAKALEEQECLHTQKAGVYEIHQMMERILKADVHAFTASIYEREND